MAATAAAMAARHVHGVGGSGCSGGGAGSASGASGVAGAVPGTGVIMNVSCAEVRECSARRSVRSVVAPKGRPRIARGDNPWNPYVPNYRSPNGATLDDRRVAPLGLRQFTLGPGP